MCEGRWCPASGLELREKGRLGLEGACRIPQLFIEGLECHVVPRRLGCVDEADESVAVGRAIIHARLQGISHSLEQINGLPLRGDILDVLSDGFSTRLAVVHGNGGLRDAMG